MFLVAALLSSELPQGQAFHAVSQPKHPWAIPSRTIHHDKSRLVWKSKVKEQIIVKRIDSSSLLLAANAKGHGDEEDAGEEEKQEMESHQHGAADGKDDAPPPALINKEMFLRDMLQDPQVLKKKKKKNGGSYQPLDNRDHLPFVVQVMTPDPYTKRQLIQEKARQRTKEENKKKKKKGSPPLSSDIASSLQLQQQDGSTQILGEFALDKSTTSGDWILIGDVEYQVTSAKCQYKYAGGKRFVMVRKILQVKEMRRVEQEAQLLRQLQSSPDVADPVLVDLWEDDATSTTTT